MKYSYRHVSFLWYGMAQLPATYYLHLTTYWPTLVTKSGTNNKHCVCRMQKTILNLCNSNAKLGYVSKIKKNKRKKFPLWMLLYFYSKTHINSNNQWCRISGVSTKIQTNSFQGENFFSSKVAPYDVRSLEK